MKLRKSVLVIVLVYFGIVLVGELAPPKSHHMADEEIEGRFYCNMVFLHKNDHSKGWPDFRHVYSEMCNKDGSLNEEYVNGR